MPLRHAPVSEPDSALAYGFHPRDLPGLDEAYAVDFQRVRRFDLRSEQTLAGFSHGQRVKALLLLNFARYPKAAVT